MPFCPNCGTQVSGQFCTKCGTDVGGAAIGGPPPISSSGLSTNLASALCYFPIVAVIFLLIEPYNKNREVRFHAWQSIFLLIVYIVLRIIIRQLWVVAWGLAATLGILVGIGELALVLYLAFRAYNNQRIVLPVIGPLAEKQA
jgi:uncharacterized membrane protein